MMFSKWLSGNANLVIVINKIPRRAMPLRMSRMTIRSFEPAGGRILFALASCICGGAVFNVNSVQLNSLNVVEELFTSF